MTLRLVEIEQHVDLPAAFEDRRLWDESLRNGTLSPYYDAQKLRLPDRLLGPLANCSSLDRFASGDDEKRACGLAALQPPCTVFSIGSNNQWGFEAAVHRQTACRVVTFDCTIARTSLPPPELRDRVRFEHACLVPDDGQPNKYFPRPALPGAGAKHLWNWSTMLAAQGMRGGSPALVKMDVEGAEWLQISSFVAAAARRSGDGGAGAPLPTQLAFEMHTAPAGKKIKRHAQVEWLRQVLAPRGPYLLLDVRRNPPCQHCSELLLAMMPDKGGSVVRRSLRPA